MLFRKYMIMCFWDCIILYFVLEWISDGYIDPAGGVFSSRLTGRMRSNIQRIQIVRMRRKQDEDHQKKWSRRNI